MTSVSYALFKCVCVSVFSKVKKDSYGPGVLRCCTVLNIVSGVYTHAGVMFILSVMFTHNAAVRSRKLQEVSV